MKLHRFVKQPINQYFGKDKTAPNMLAFYNSLGLQGHNGWDFACYTGTEVRYGGFDEGLVESIYWDALGGNSLHIITDNYRLIFYHLKDITVKVGQSVKMGNLIAHTDNTGTGTTGPHLHFGIKEVIKDVNGNYQSVNKDNRYGGCLDPTQFDTGIYVVDYINTQIGIIQKLLNILKQLLNLMK